MKSAYREVIILRINDFYDTNQTSEHIISLLPFQSDGIFLFVQFYEILQAFFAYHSNTGLGIYIFGHLGIKKLPLVGRVNSKLFENVGMDFIAAEIF